MTRRRYELTAFLLGIVWYVALLIPSITRQTLHFNYNGKVPTYPIVMLLLMCGVSVGLAEGFRSWIVNARGWQNMALGLMLPFIGAILFGCLTSVVWLGFGADPRELSKILVMFPLFGLWYAVISWAVVIPLGCLSQFLMRCAGRAAR